MVDLTVQLLAARCGPTFRRGFRLRAIGRQLYVQIAGRKVPLYLRFDVDPQQVQERASRLERLLEVRLGRFDSEAWREACGGPRARKGKSEKARLNLDEVVAKWHRLKAAEGISASTFERHYMIHLRRLDEKNPLGESSLLRAIEQTDPRSPTRRRVVAFLRRLCALCGAEWNAALLDPLQNSGKSLQHRAQAFFRDEQIEAFLAPSSPLSGPWRRAVALMAIYGLRPWEAWIAEPSKGRPSCVWIGTGKTNRRGTTNARQVPPFHPEWIERFDLESLWHQSLPRLSELGQAGSRVNQQLRRAGLVTAKGETAYGFRHAYARRLHSPRYRVVDAHAALFMGHSVVVHNQIYRAWLGGEDPIGLYLEDTTEK